jgi:hypothetical protein
MYMCVQFRIIMHYVYHVYIVHVHAVDVHVCTRMHMYVLVCVRTHMYMYVRVCIHLSVYVCINACVCACVCKSSEPLWLRVGPTSYPKQSSGCFKRVRMRVRVSE